MSAFARGMADTQCLDSIFHFLLGFSASGLLSSHVAHGSVLFFRKCFLEAAGGSEPQAVSSSAWAFRSMTLAFAGDTASHSHTGVIFLDHTGGRYFRMGIPGVMIFGLGMMPCPFGHVSMEVQISHSRFECRCGATAPITRPDFVEDANEPGMPPGHYVCPFPFPEGEDKVTWTAKNGNSRNQKWSEIWRG